MESPAVGVREYSWFTSSQVQHARGWRVAVNKGVGRVLFSKDKSVFAVMLALMGVSSGKQQAPTSAASLLFGSFRDNLESSATAETVRKPRLILLQTWRNVYKVSK